MKEKQDEVTRLLLLFFVHVYLGADNMNISGEFVPYVIILVTQIKQQVTGL